MNTTFANDHERLLKLQAAYQEADTQEERDAIRAQYETLKNSVQEKGDDYSLVLRLYSAMRERDNDYLDISDCHDYQDEKHLVETLRTFGFEHFAFSSTWSSAVQSGWAFIQNGCALIGMLEVNRDWAPLTGQHRKVPAYLFAIN